jgi:hypothetical protein
MNDEFLAFARLAREVGIAPVELRRQTMVRRIAAEGMG